MQKIGFIGTGVMGAAIAGHILDAGYPVTVYNRTKAKTDALVAKGAVWAETPQAVAEASEVVFTMVGYPSDVEETYLGEVGIFQADVKEKTLIDMTTSTPTLAKKLAEVGAEKGAHVLDAPVSGGDTGAKNGTLTIMVGGEKAAYDAVQPLLELFGQKWQLQGPAGSGQHTKMANQIMIAGTMTGMTEVLLYAEKTGLDPLKVLDSLSGGGAANWSLSNYGPRILKGDFAPGFFVKHFLKDLRIALDEAQKLDLDLPGTKLAEKLYAQLVDEGYENEGTQALIKLWQEKA